MESGTAASEQQILDKRTFVHLGQAMIPVRSDVRIWLATGCTDMRPVMFGPALQVQVQQGLKRDPHAGDLYIFGERRGDLIKVLWHDGVGTSLYAKRFDRGRFIWPVDRRPSRTLSLRGTKRLKSQTNMTFQGDPIGTDCPLISNLFAFTNV
ncbi:IS66 family insertion sequence element accessory protein TnpB [Sphingomonas glacialis]|uniref:Transposase n=1 Tax=Sphingomonas glacialis TaxID=658225 RepID=A0A502FS34_9SPHN|nr:IS66 family insertion sequence element accessory protein TnpB [Sphingomonas glacialis]TPG52190.1 transposase [Sphingomonas glacialis]